MVCDPDLLEQIELSLENVRQVRKVRQQLMASLNELQKCEEDVFNSLNKVGDRLRRNMLQFQGRGVSGERVGDVVAVDGEINHGHVNSITVTTVSSGRGESTSVAAGSRESGTSCTTSVSENSYAGMTRRAAWECRSSTSPEFSVRAAGKEDEISSAQWNCFDLFLTVSLSSWWRTMRCRRSYFSRIMKNIRYFIV